MSSGKEFHQQGLIGSIQREVNSLLVFHNGLCCSEVHSPLLAKLLPACSHNGLCLILPIYMEQLLTVIKLMGQSSIWTVKGKVEFELRMNTAFRLQPPAPFATDTLNMERTWGAKGKENRSPISEHRQEIHTLGEVMLVQRESGE